MTDRWQWPPLPLDCSLENLDRLITERLYSDEGQRIMERQAKGASMTEQDFIIELAERVLGWRRTPIIYEDHDTPEGFPAKCYRVLDGRVEYWVEARRGDWRVKPYTPLTSDADALGLVDAAFKSGRFCCIKIDGDHGYVWKVTVIEGETGSGEKYEHKPCGQATIESRPVAICYAIARAHDIELPEGV